jgi:hypothetical protein
MRRRALGGPGTTRAPVGNFRPFTCGASTSRSVSRSPLSSARSTVRSTARSSARSNITSSRNPSHGGQPTGRRSHRVNASFGAPAQNEMVAWIRASQEPKYQFSASSFGAGTLQENTGNTQTRSELMRVRKMEEHAAWAPSLQTYMPPPRDQILRGGPNVEKFTPWQTQWRGNLAQRGLAI